MNGLLIRTDTSDEGTRGVLIVAGFFCFTLELPWRDNQHNISCIPVGSYTVIPAKSRRLIAGTRDHLLITDVPDRDGVFMHAGNILHDTLGCPLVGTRRGSLSGQIAVLNSRTAERRLKEAVAGRKFTLSIRELYHGP